MQQNIQTSQTSYSDDDDLIIREYLDEPIEQLTNRRTFVPNKHRWTIVM